MMKDANQVYREVASRICGNFDLAIALKDCKDYLQSIMPINIIHLSVVDLQLSGARMVAYVSDKGIETTDESWFIPFPSDVIDFIKERVPGVVYTFGDGYEAPPYRIGAQFMGRTEPFSVLNLKLSMEDGLIGVISLIAWGNNRYTDEHARLFEHLDNPFAITLLNALRYQEILRLRDEVLDDNRQIQQDMRKLTGDNVIGATSGLKKVMDLVKQVAPLKSPVLLLGETGVGKEVIANAIHDLSGRKQGPMIKVHCGSIPGSLIDSELFGHEKGAFTGASSRKRGRFERSNNGSIFLDEIGELPLAAQVRFLRVLQEMEIERVGGTQTIPVDVRVIAATHRDLKSMLQEGRFREDLWHRINVFPIIIPPLRERKLDIPLLTYHFIQQKSKEMNLPVIPSLANGEMDQLSDYDWPGNVRELQNVIERALILSQGKLLRFPDLGGFQRLFANTETDVNANKIPTLDEIMIQHIRHTLSMTEGRIEGKGGAAELLGIHYNTLRARMKKLGINFGRSL